MQLKRRRGALDGLGAGAAVLALVAAPLVGTTISATAAAGGPVLSQDFQANTWAPWVQSGGPELSVVDDNAYLEVANRSQDYDGLSSPEYDFDAGTTYRMSARVRLAPGTVGTSQLRFVTKVDYQWVGGSQTPFTAEDWTTVTVDYTPAADTTSSVYLGTESLTGPYTYLVDDLAITELDGDGEPVADVTSVDFETEDYDGWVQSGGPTLTRVPERYLSVAERAEDYDGITSPAFEVEAGATYEFFARARLAEGTPGVTQLRFVAIPGTWIGNTTIDADGWTTVRGEHTFDEAGEVQVYLGTSPIDGLDDYTYLVDDIVVTKTGDGDEDGGSPGEPGEPVVVLSSDFETGVDPWGPHGDGVPTHSATGGRDGSGAMLVSGRTQNWHGASANITELFAPGGTYTVTAYVRMAPGQADDQVKMTVAETPENHTQVMAPATVTASGWTKLEGTYTRGAGVTGGVIYFEATGATSSFLVDDVTIVGPAFGSIPVDDWEPDLDGFVLGGAVNPRVIPVSGAREAADGGPRVALTFDDGPSPADTPTLLDFLASKDIKATFCVIGSQITADGGADLLRRIVSEGHQLCNHSTGWNDMGNMSRSAVEADMKANLQIIRDALGDPEAKVPYFRAPNGSWGKTREVAVALGMQPLAVTNTIADWETQDVDTLTDNLRAAIHDGQIVLVHDGGGAVAPWRNGSVAAVRTVVDELLADGWSFTFPEGGDDSSWEMPSELNADFEDGTLQGWTARNTGETPHEVDVVSPGHAGSQYAAIVSDRDNQGDGLQYDVTGVFEPGATYDFSAALRFADGEAPGEMTLSARSVSDGSEFYPNLVALPGVTNSWTTVSGAFTMPSYTDEVQVYFETKWADGAVGNTSTFLVDDISFVKRPEPVVQDDLASLYDFVDVPFGVAIDSRETQRTAAKLLTKHFEQVTAENAMKPENWYDAAGSFAPNAEITSILDFAVANDLRVYGHVLVWHSQTPDWFFQDGAGAFLPVDDASAEIVRGRMETHIENVARWIAENYGEFGSPTNPVVGWDVVNEVISDDDTDDGMRRSRWYQYLGEEFVDAAFEYAETYMNGVYHADGGEQVQLFINDYNSELLNKQDRYFALVERLLARGVPIDGVGHQFHVSLSLPVQLLEGALERFSGLGLQQAVTEFDVTTGIPATEALFVEQGYYYRDAFDIFERYEDDLFSITVWGLYDTRSWRNHMGGPLVFDEQMQAKPAYYGIVGDDLPARIRSANAFEGDVAVDEDAFEALTWWQLPMYEIGQDAAFQARWAKDHLTVYAEVLQRYGTLEVQVGDDVWTVSRDGEGDLDAAVAESDEAWAAVFHVPVTAQRGDVLDFDLRVVDGTTVVGWNTPGHLGDLNLVEPLSTTEVLKAPTVPTVDGAVDDVWAKAASFTTTTQVEGEGGASATVRTLWQDRTLYVLADVVDASVEASTGSAQQRDRVEIFLDAGNVKHPTYRYDDLHVRVDAAGNVTLGQGDEGFHRGRIEARTELTSTGYRVEAAIDMLDQYVGEGTFHGLDVHVADVTDGVQTSVRSWADPTGLSHYSTERWGVAHLVSTLTPPAEDAKPQLSFSLPAVRAGQPVRVDLAGFTPGDRVAIAMGDAATASGGAGGVGAAVAGPAGTTVLGSVIVAGDGTASLSVTVPASTTPGVYRVVAAVDQDVLAEGALTVLAADEAAAPGTTTPGKPGGKLATTGAGLGLGLLAVLVLVTGSVLLAVRRRGHLASEVERTLRG